MFRFRHRQCENITGCTSLAFALLQVLREGGDDSRKNESSALGFPDRSLGQLRDSREAP